MQTDLSTLHLFSLNNIDLERYKTAILQILDDKKYVYDS